MADLLITFSACLLALAITGIAGKLWGYYWRWLQGPHHYSDRIIQPKE